MVRILAAVLAVVVLAGLGVGGWALANQLLEDDDGPGTPTPSPTATPGATASGTAVTEGLRLLYREFGDEADILWMGAAADPQTSEAIASIEHAPGVGISATLSPDGEKIAYLVLTTPGRDEQTEAQAWVLDVDRGKPRFLVERVDRGSRIVWSPDSKSIIVRRNGPMGGIGRTASLVQVDVSGGSETLLMEAGDILELFAIGYSSDGKSLYLARITIQGTDFEALPAMGGTPEVLVHASDQPARDWHLSPDGDSIVFLARQATDSRIAVRASVADLVGGGVPQPLSSFAEDLDAGDHFNSVWHPDGDRIAVGRSPADGASTAAVVSLSDGELAEATPGPQRGFDVPLGWSPDGSYLVVRSFEGSSAAQPGREHLVIMELGKGRAEVDDGGTLDFIGWVEGDGR
jgi:Tol biopolymer transport system component